MPRAVAGALANREALATIARLEEGPWKPLGAFDEFKDSFAGAPPPPPTDAQFATARAGSETNGMAVAGLVCSILGFLCCCPFVGSILGITFSVIGLNQINAQPSRYSTSPVIAKVGIGIGVAGLVFSLIGLAWNVATGAFHGILQALKAGR